MKIIRALLLGCGGVGRQLIDHIVACRSLHSKQGLAIRVVGIGDSRSLIVVNDVFNMELQDAFLKEICRIKSSGSSLSSLTDLGQSQIFKNSEAINKIIDSASLLGRSTGLVLVDCSASSETIEDDYDQLLSDFRHIRFESTALEQLSKGAVEALGSMWEKHAGGGRSPKLGAGEARWKRCGGRRTTGDGESMVDRLDIGRCGQMR
ncbi:hypothetical protein KSP40_PGU018165 [Platanthera guangdongensis]|uniref:Tubulin/FtsZ GTPase domain-containing protein n=1 Tax=Platanthera guangdongensis TaxID=2320717 RepID=A0ABR2MKK0_9ASPA